MTKITSITSREIIESRGNPTVETTVHLEDGSYGIASIPSGASVGSHEAVELRDGDPKRFNGMGMLKVINNVLTVLAPKIVGMDASQQKQIDDTMIAIDGTENKQNLGANSILSISLATAVAQANSEKKPLYRYLNEIAKNLGINASCQRLPTPAFNIINGGKHGAGNLDFQEFIVVPATVKPFSEALQIGVEIYHELKKVLTYRNAVHSVGDEGGFAPNLFTNMDACEAIAEAMRATPYKIGFDVFFGLDLAPENFMKGDKFQIKDRPQPLTREEFVTYLEELNNEYHLLYMEDPLHEDDWDGWKELTKRFTRTMVIVGDDLLVTNPKRLEKSIEMGACTGILVKPNQIGTLSETLAVVKRAKEAGMRTIISHRSGETNDTFIADLAVAVDAEYVKFGAPARGERVAKYNRLLKIEAELQTKSQ